MNTTESFYLDVGCEDLTFTVTPVNDAGEGVPNSVSLSWIVNGENRR
jgi:hypothetical protein